MRRFEFIDPMIPGMYMLRLPAGEKETARFGEDQLLRMTSEIDCISYALKLIDHCDEQRIARQQVRNQMRKRDDEAALRMTHADRMEAHRKIIEHDSDRTFLTWAQMAGREIVIRVSDFRVHLTSAKTAMQRSKTLWSLIDNKKIDDAIKLFDGRYPDSYSMRSAAVHQAEYASKPSFHTANSITAEVEGVIAGGGRKMVTSCLMNRTIIFSGLVSRSDQVPRESTEFRLELTEALIESLTAIALLAFSCMTLERLSGRAPSGDFK